MRRCIEERTSFPDSEFKLIDGHWYHDPPGRDPHPAERPGPKTPLRPPLRVDRPDENSDD